MTNKSVNIYTVIKKKGSVVRILMITKVKNGKNKIFN